jgi:membrane-anchored protein YejM (alkaline phosphatase superfamily)
MGPTELTKPEERSRRRLLIRWWGWLVICTAAFACLIALRYFAAAELTGSPFLALFSGAMLISHFTLLSALMLLPLLALILLAPRPSLACPAGVVWVALILCALLIDTQVFHLYRFHINAGVMNLLLGGAAAETFVFPPEMYLQAAAILLGVALCVALLAAAAWRYVRRRAPRFSMPKPFIAVIVLCTLVFHGVHVWGDATAHKAIMTQPEILPFRYAATAKRLLRSWGFEVRARPQLKAARDADGGLMYPLEPLACRADAPRRNVIFIAVDSWRFDALDPRMTPNVHAFAQRSARFTNHFSGGNATRIGVFSLFYGIPGTYWHRILAEQRRPVLIEELLRRDYAISVFRSAPLYSPEFDRTIFAGLDVRRRSAGERPWQWDRDLTDDFKQFLATRRKDQPFFAFLFYDSPHSFDMPPDYPLQFVPSGPRVNYIELHGLKDVRPFLNRYANSVHYVDSLIGEALQAIESAGLLADSIIVITGDHGQEFNDVELDYWGHGSNFTRYQTGVPFLLYAPEIEPKTYTHRTSHFDVAPTLMQEYFGCHSPLQSYTVGHSLFEIGGREMLLMSEYADFAIVQPDVIAVVREHGMAVVDPQYEEREGLELAPSAIAKALEHKRRFYRVKRLDDA